MKKTLISLFVSIIIAKAAFAQNIENPLLSAIVKIECVSSSPDFRSPWTNKAQAQCGGSGVVIAGNLILTNAHNIADATYISVSKNNDGFPVTAKVFAVNHQCDLALLKIDEARFFDGIVPLELGKTPPMQTMVFAIGYPIGGAEISITQGIISRIECVEYSHNFLETHLAAQLDAALNPGNSGGPVIFEGKVVGIAFQSRAGGDGIGYMIHSDVIEQFLKDVSDGKVDGIGELGIHVGLLTNPDTRRLLKMGEKQSGVLISKVKKSALSEPQIMENDVITAIDGIPIMNNMNIKNERGENVFFATVAKKKQLGESVVLDILRDGKTLKSKVKTTRPWTKVSPNLYDKRPRYIIVGGLVFSELSFSYFEELGRDLPPTLFTLGMGEKNSADEDSIVLTQVLGDETNTGYQMAENEILESVNGKKVSNLKELAEIVDSINSGAITFKFQYDNKIILDAQKIKAALPDILKRYNIGVDRKL